MKVVSDDLHFALFISTFKYTCIHTCVMKLCSWPVKQSTAAHTAINILLLHADNLQSERECVSACVCGGGWVFLVLRCWVTTAVCNITAPPPGGSIQSSSHCGRIPSMLTKPFKTLKGSDLSSLCPPVVFRNVNMLDKTCHLLLIVNVRCWKRNENHR